MSLYYIQENVIISLLKLYTFLFLSIDGASVFGSTVWAGQRETWHTCCNIFPHLQNCITFYEVGLNWFLTQVKAYGTRLRDGSLIATLASQTTAGHSLNFIITIVIMTLG